MVAMPRRRKPFSPWRSSGSALNRKRRSALLRKEGLAAAALRRSLRGDRGLRTRVFAALLVIVLPAGCNGTKDLGDFNVWSLPDSRKLHEPDYTFDRLRLPNATAYTNGFFPIVACESIKSLKLYNEFGERGLSDLGLGDCSTIPMNSELRVRGVLHVKGDEYVVRVDGPRHSEVYVGAADIEPGFAPEAIVKMRPLR